MRSFMPKRTTALGHTAIEKAVRGATAMGFAWVELRDAETSGHEVVVQIVATDEEPDEVTEVTPGGELQDSDEGCTGERELRHMSPDAGHI